MERHRVVQNFITKEELTKVVNKKPTSFFPFWFLENKLKGEDNV